MRWKLLYPTALLVAATAVFSATYFFGRHPSLEAELELLTAPRSISVPEKSRGIPSLARVERPPQAPEQPVPAGEPLGEGILAVRSPLEPSGMVIVADLPALLPNPAGQTGPVAGGLEAFLARPPTGLQIGLRALSGTGGGCGRVESIATPGSGSAAGEFAAALAAASRREPSPRNPAGAVQAAAEDLENVPGERAIVVLAGGEEECAADLCGSGPSFGGTVQRVHVLLLAPPPRTGVDPALPEAWARGGASPPVFEPPWDTPYRCLAERSGGTIAAVLTAADLETALRRIAGELESAIVVKALHFTGQEVRGLSPGGDAGWGATLRLGGAAGAGAGTRESPVFPAAFAVPAGVYVLKAFYGGQARTAAVAVALGERTEVRVAFATGELYVQARDAAGNEIAGDSDGFRCAWGVDVHTADAEEGRPVASTCSFPARLELAPGTYRVRARWKGLERIIEEATVEAGANAVHTVSFGKDGN